MNKKDHGNDSHENLFEQYKLYVEMSNDVSKRRHQTNSFYISLSSALIALFSLITVKLGSINLEFISLLPIFGLLTCFIWFTHIKSYKKLNSAKFKVINEIEKDLPYQGFSKEWEILKNESYKGLTDIEKCVPLFIGILYIILLLYLNRANIHILLSLI
ncbi:MULTISPECIES: RipA family octameric membrane protein [Methanobacterium]|uniref:Uncharacterized protein n=1 Tax=Methanobacterium bryantii TaxID=2161 RepID=A0A2A2H8B9_METBR|nr:MULTISPECIES: hypothetical protein [Methanobacterium]OEC84347.1 hypothetical protein A9507_15730 [Methanobacterium sp. A39]PAV05503.1 hypothetical protein ASJ80_09005 [Methanobacterium bryantii]